MWRLEKRGYAVVASNVRSRALKIFYRVYAQQRLKFKEEIFDEIQRLGGHSRPRSNILGILHRGRIDIFTAMMIGDEGVENLLLKEILVGESAALRAHEKTLKPDLPPETREMVERQFNEVRNILGQARLMKGIIGMGSLGVLAGILAALGIAQISHSAGEEAPLVITILAILGLVAGGIFIGGMAGLFIGSWKIHLGQQEAPKPADLQDRSPCPAHGCN